MTRRSAGQGAAIGTYASWDISRLHSQPWLDDATPGDRIAVRAGTVIFAQQQVHRYFYLIRSGYVQASIARAHGSTLLLEIYGPHTLFGEGAAFEQGPRFVTATAVSDCALVRFDPAALEGAFAANPQLPIALIRLMSAKQRALAGKVAGLSATAPQARLCGLLLRVAQAEQSQRGAGSPLSVHLSHEQLGAMAGLARVTVTRTLARLARQGLVRTSPRAVELLDPARLAAMQQQG